MFGDRGHSEEGHAATMLGKGSRINGTLSFEGTVRIDGQVEGEIAAQESVVIGESAVVKAHVSADSIVITGKVTGDITARRRVEIRAPGKLYGNITTPSLVIHDGVVFEGRCSMGGGEQKIDSGRTRMIGDANGEPEAVAMAADADAKWSASH
jgi:cytoskeletal protein CcmA (bactofilin family)